ncbi:MAG: SpaH/EbpB family LPXTG-anchored major pilin [Clostridiales bacterium]|nr:SpaH/EbpB family LPXTG-anchored major pilin [Clostridiales bacterium]
MKKIKTLPMILALIFVLALPMGVFATGENAKITISASESLTLTATDFTAYKLFDVTVSGSGSSAAYAYTPVQPSVDSFLSWATTKYGASSPYGTAAANFKTFLEGNPTAAQMKTLTKDLYDSNAFIATGTRTKVGNNVEISGLDFGYYLVVGEGAPTAGGAKVIAHSTLVTVDSQNVPIRLKAEAPEIEKGVSDVPIGIGASGWGTNTNVNIGDTVYFRLLSRVPDMTGYDSYTFDIKDTMSKGLTFDSNSVSIVLADNLASPTPTQLQKDVHYTVNSAPITTGAGGTLITISFTNFLQHAAKAGWYIVATYNATLNQDAVIAPQSNPNSVILEYSNNPYTNSIGNTPGSEVDVYTFDLKVTKIDGSSGVALGGAIFELRTTAGNAATAKSFTLVTAGTATLPSVYAVARPGGQATTDLVVPASGLLHIKGLKAGTYSLFEKEAPAGYNRLTDETPVVIAHTVTGGNSNYVTVDITVENNSGIKLPGTGGAGTLPYYLVGILLAIGLAVFLVTRKRRNILKAK